MNSEFNGINIRRDSLSHRILMITKVYNRLINISDLKEINLKQFSSLSKVNRSLLSLALHEFIIKFEDDTWIITEKGKRFLYHVVAKYPRPIYSQED